MQLPQPGVLRLEFARRASYCCILPPSTAVTACARAADLSIGCLVLLQRRHDRGAAGPIIFGEELALAHRADLLAVLRRDRNAAAGLALGLHFGVGIDLLDEACGCVTLLTAAVSVEAVLHLEHVFA